MGENNGAKIVQMFFGREREREITECGRLNYKNIEVWGEMMLFLIIKIC